MAYRHRAACLIILLTWPVLVITQNSDYTIIELETLPIFNLGSPSAINERGQISGTLGFFPTHAVMWDNGSVIDLATTSVPSNGGPGINSGAQGINNRGQVVGGFSQGHGGVLWEKGTMTDLAGISPVDINEGGQIAGSSGSHAALWRNGVDLGVLPGDTNSEASAINNSGRIVGISFVAGSSSSRGFLWEKGTMSELPGLDGRATAVFDINERGQVVGDAGLLPVMWENGTLIRLETLPPLTIGRAFGINDNGDIVGYLQSPTSFARVAVLWRHGKPVALPTLPPPPGTSSDYIALGINNSGTIIGTRQFSGFPFPLVWVRNGARGIE